VLAVGDGALGFWRALREVFPETRQARCWFHKIANVLAALPKWHPAAKNALAEIWNAEDKTHGSRGGRPQGVAGARADAARRRCRCSPSRPTSSALGGRRVLPTDSVARNLLVS